MRVLFASKPPLSKGGGPQGRRVKTPPYILNLIGGEDVGADSISVRESCRCHKQARANNVRPYKTSIHIIQ